MKKLKCEHKARCGTKFIDVTFCECCVHNPNRKYGIRDHFELSGNQTNNSSDQSTPYH